MLNVVAVSASGGTAHATRTVLFDFVPGTLHPRRDRSVRRRPRPRQLRVPDLLGLPSRRLRHRAVPGVRRRLGRHLPRPGARPVADLQQPARRSARRCVRPRARRRTDLDGRRGRITQLHDRAALCVEQADPGAGLRPAVRGRDGGDARHGRDQCESDLAVHHLPRPEGDARHAGAGVGVQRGADRPGRLQQRSGARVPADPAAVPVRRLRDGDRQRALQLPARRSSRRRWT